MRQRRLLSQKFPFSYFALALSQEFAQFSRSEARIMAKNFRFFLFSEIYDHERIGHFVSRKPCHILIQGLIAELSTNLLEEIVNADVRKYLSSLDPYKKWDNTLKRCFWHRLLHYHTTSYTELRILM